MATKERVICLDAAGLSPGSFSKWVPEEGFNVSVQSVPYLSDSSSNADG